MSLSDLIEDIEESGGSAAHDGLWLNSDNIMVDVSPTHPDDERAQGRTVFLNISAKNEQNECAVFISPAQAFAIATMLLRVAAQEDKKQ